MKFITCGTDLTERERVVAPKTKTAGPTDSGGHMIDGARFGFGTAFGVALGLFAGGVVISKVRGA